MVVDVTLHGDSCPKQHLHGEEMDRWAEHPCPCPLGEGALTIARSWGRECPVGIQTPIDLGPAMVAVGSGEYVPVSKGLWGPRTLFIPVAPTRVGELQGRPSPWAGLYSKLGVHKKERFPGTGPQELRVRPRARQAPGGPMPVRLENHDRVMVGATSKIRTLGESQEPSRQETGLGSVGETGGNEGELSGSGGEVRETEP